MQRITFHDEKKTSWSKIIRLVPVAFAALVLAVFVLASGLPSAAVADSHVVEHPMMKPEKFTEHLTCENCGMNRNMWARTRHIFTNSEGTQYTCSLHCIADLSAKAGEEPKDVKVALYLSPDKMIAADKALYVVGSRAVGTMTMNSKLAFADREAAETFVKENGGEITDFAGAFTKATTELAIDRQKIAEKRQKTGKIKIPGENEPCTVCGMYPARFPAHRAQILTMDKETIHFCSTSCLAKYLAAPDQYVSPAPKAMNTWVTVYPEGGYDYAGGLYYVVGSSVMGSMGPEALPFRNRADAVQFASDKGGKVLHFNELSPDVVGSGMMKMH